VAHIPVCVRTVEHDLIYLTWRPNGSVRLEWDGGSGDAVVLELDPTNARALATALFGATPTRPGSA
jgi:hypothetical protein